MLVLEIETCETRLVNVDLMDRPTEKGSRINNVEAGN